MLITSILLLLSSNAVSQRRDKSILYARLVITILVCCFILCFNSFYPELLDKNLGLFGGLYHTTAVTHILHLFIILVSGLIIQLKVFNSDLSLSILKTTIANTGAKQKPIKLISGFFFPYIKDLKIRLSNLKIRLSNIKLSYIINIILTNFTLSKFITSSLVIVIVALTKIYIYGDLKSSLEFSTLVAFGYEGWFFNTVLFPLVKAQLDWWGWDLPAGKILFGETFMIMGEIGGNSPSGNQFPLASKPSSLHMQGNSVNSPNENNSDNSPSESNSVDSPGVGNSVNRPSLNKSDTNALADSYLYEYVANKQEKGNYSEEEFTHNMLKEPRLICTLFRKHYCTNEEKKELLEISKFLLEKFGIDYSDHSDSIIISKAKKYLNLKKNRLFELERDMGDDNLKKIKTIEKEIAADRYKQLWANRTEAEKEARNLKLKEKRENMTESQREADKDKAKQLWANKTEAEKKAQYLRRNEKKENMTESQREAIKEAQYLKQKEKRENMTESQREAEKEAKSLKRRQAWANRTEAEKEAKSLKRKQAWANKKNKD